MSTLARRLLHTARDRTGFGLLETLVGLSVLTATLGLLGGGLYHAYSIQRFWQKDAIATKEWRHAGSWFARDSIRSQSTSLADGSSASSLTLSWTYAGTTHTVLYSVSGSELLRSYDGGAPMTLVRDLSSASFSRSGRTLSFTVTVNADRGGTEQKSLATYLRAAQP